MKSIKFTMSKGDDIILPFNKAEAIIESQGQLIKINDDSGVWTGKVINKAHIISSKVDFNATLNTKKLIPQDSSVKNIEENKKALDKIRETIKNKLNK